MSDGRIDVNENGEHFLIIDMDDIDEQFFYENEERLRWNVRDDGTVEILLIDNNIETGYN